MTWIPAHPALSVTKVLAMGRNRAVKTTLIKDLFARAVGVAMVVMVTGAPGWAATRVEKGAEPGAVARILVAPMTIVPPEITDGLSPVPGEVLSSSVAEPSATTESATTQTSSGPTETIEYYAVDTVGSTRVVFAPDGTVVGRGDYLPFGENLSSANLPAERFTGQERDAESGMDYFNARNYEPRTGRFNAVDPLVGGALSNPQLWNRYAYALNNPLAFTDPSGMIPNDQCSWNGTTINCPQPAKPLYSGLWSFLEYRLWGYFTNLWGSYGGQGGSSGGASSGPSKPAPAPAPAPTPTPTPTPPGPNPGPNPPTPPPGPPTPPTCEATHSCGPITDHNLTASPGWTPPPMRLTSATPVSYLALSGSLVAIYGVHGSGGLYWQGCCMPAGLFYSYGAGIGWNVGIGPVVGRYDNMSHFNGYSNFISASAFDLGGSIYYPGGMDSPPITGWDFGASFGPFPFGFDVGGSNTVPKPF
jgi:RHS repeat-associated protein